MMMIMLMRRSHPLLLFLLCWIVSTTAQQQETTTDTNTDTTAIPSISLDRLFSGLDDQKGLTSILKNYSKEEISKLLKADIENHKHIFDTDLLQQQQQQQQNSYLKANKKQTQPYQPQQNQQTQHHAHRQRRADYGGGSSKGGKKGGKKGNQLPPAVPGPMGCEVEPLPNAPLKQQTCPGHFDSIIAFGDSTTDTGSAATAAVCSVPGVECQTRAGNGYLSVDFVAAALGVGPLTPAFDYGAMDFAGGNNFGYAGAFARPSNTEETIQDQVNLYQRWMQQGVGMPSTQARLHWIQVGGNDIFSAVFSYMFRSLGQGGIAITPQQVLTFALIGVSRQLETLLAMDNVCNVVVSGYPDLSLLPAAMLWIDFYGGVLQVPNLKETIIDLVQRYNQGLLAEVVKVGQRFQDKCSDATFGIRYLDVYSLVEQAMMNKPELGYKENGSCNIRDTVSAEECLAVTAIANPGDSDIPFVSLSLDNSVVQCFISVKPIQDCECDGYLFHDGRHPTQALNKETARLALEVLASTDFCGEDDDDDDEIIVPGPLGCPIQVPENNDMLDSCSFENMVVFGDSLADSGAFSTLPFCSTRAGIVPCTSRFSDGPVLVEHIAAAVGLGPLTNSFDYTTQTFTGGTNFGFAGAEARPSTGDGIAVIDQFRLYQVGYGIAQVLPVPNENTLYVVQGGGNDILKGVFRYIIEGGDLQVASQAIEYGLSGVLELLQEMLDMPDACNILVIGAPDLSATPNIRVMANFYEALGIPSVLEASQQMSSSFNTAVLELIDGQFSSAFDAKCGGTTAEFGIRFLPVVDATYQSVEENGLGYSPLGGPCNVRQLVTGDECIAVAAAAGAPVPGFPVTVGQDLSDAVVHCFFPARPANEDLNCNCEDFAFFDDLHPSGALVKGIADIVFDDIEGFCSSGDYQYYS